MLFEQLKNIVSILFFNFIEFIILLYTFSNFYMIWLILFIKFSIILHLPMTKLLLIFEGFFFVNIFSCLRSDLMVRDLKWHSWAKILGRRFPCICLLFGNIPLFKSLRIFCLKLRSVIAFLRVRDFFFFSFICGFVDYLMILISSFNLICCSSALSHDELLICISMPKDLTVLNFWKSYVLSFYVIMCFIN